MESLHKLVDLVNNAPTREQKMTAFATLYEHMACRIDDVRAHPKLYDAARKKLLEFVVMEDWDDGRRYFPHFKINSIQESFFTIRALTGLSQTGFISTSRSITTEPAPLGQ
jgi:hypothetical protein